jgi:hypothetical protein
MGRSVSVAFAFFGMLMVSVGAAQPIMDPHADLADLFRLDDAQSGQMAQFTSYDRSGANYDWSNWDYIRAEPLRTVMADVRGPGCITRIWATAFDTTNTWIEVYLDDSPTPMVSERMFNFFGHVEPFVLPLAGPSSGGWVSYVPIPFARSCRIEAIDPQGSTNQFYYHVGYRTYPPGAPLPGTFQIPPTPAQQLALDALADQYAQVGEDPKAEVAGETTVTGSIGVPAGQTVTLAALPGAGTITAVNLTVTPNTTTVLDGIRLRARWDGSVSPSIDAPIGSFFGTFFGPANPAGLPAGTISGQMYNYLPMPFDDGAVVEIHNPLGIAVTAVNYSITWLPQSAPEVSRLRLNTQYRSQTPTISGVNYRVLQVTGTGHYVGCVLAFDSPLDNWILLEGDEKIYVDGESFPSLHGTGTEDHFNGGFYFTQGAFSFPFHGCSVLNVSTRQMSAYRFHVSDPIPFREAIIFDIEHGQYNDFNGDYFSTAFYYLDQGDGAPPAEPVYPPLNEGTLVNGDFEGGFSGYANSEANEWIGYQSDPYFDTVRCTWEPSTTIVHGGSAAQRIIVREPLSTIGSGGIVQQVPVIKGETYRVTAHVYLTLTGGAPVGSIVPRVGLGPGGNSDFIDPGLVWTAGPTSANTWHTIITPGVVAETDFMGVFVEGRRTSTAGTTSIHVDDVTFERTSVLAGPVIELDTHAINAMTVEQYDPADDTFTVRNAGPGTLNYSVTDDADWLSVTPDTGSSIGEADVLTIEYNTATLAQGVYQASIHVGDAVAVNTPQAIVVTLLVDQLVIPGDFDDDKDVDLDDWGRMQVCLTASGSEQNDPACAPAILDGDPDVDAGDVVVFQGCMSGAGIPGDPTCAD